MITLHDLLTTRFPLTSDSLLAASPVIEAIFGVGEGDVTFEVKGAAAAAVGDGADRSAAAASVGDGAYRGADASDGERAADAGDNAFAELCLSFGELLFNGGNLE